MDELEIVLRPSAQGMWRAVILKLARGAHVEGFDSVGEAFDIAAPDFADLERRMKKQRLAYRKRDLLNGSVRMVFPRDAVPVALEWVGATVLPRAPASR